MLYGMAWGKQNKTKQTTTTKQTNKQIKKLSCDAGKPWKNS